MPVEDRSSEGLAVISLQDVGGFRARLAPKSSVGCLLVLEADSLQETNTRKVADVGDSEHLPNASGREEKLESVAYRSGCNATALSARFEREANLGGVPVSGQEHANVADETVRRGLSDAELNPFTEREQRNGVHLVEERQRLALGHRRPTLEAAKLGDGAVRLERGEVTHVKTTKQPTRKDARKHRGAWRVHDG